MAEISKSVVDDVEYDIKDATARANLGDLSALKTTNKSDTVSAINEVFSMAKSAGGGGLPVVTTGDNGKILQVVNGAWAAVPMADSGVKTYIEEYINSALEGEY